MRTLDYVYLLLPVLLWPLVFIVFSGTFVYAMACATLLLAALTLLRYKKYVFWKAKRLRNVLLLGLAGAIALYAIFYAGYLLASYVGYAIYVQEVYALIYSNGSTLVLAALLALIRICEEIYWRGGLRGSSQTRVPGPGTGGSSLHSTTHSSTSQPSTRYLWSPLFFVGLIASALAKRYRDTRLMHCACGMD